MSRRSLLVLLFASLALNLFVLGAVAGAAFLGGRFHHHRPAPRGGAPMFAAAAALPQAERTAYSDTLRAAAAEAGPKLREARAARREAWGRLAADPPDAAAVTAELDRARALEAQAREDVDHRVVDFAARLPPPERHALAQALAAPPQRHGPRHDPPPPGR
jgi:uncharacterized membrane protein